MILVFVEQDNGKIKKSSIEAAYYSSQAAIKLGTTAEAVAPGQFNDGELASLGQYGIAKIHHVNNAKLNHFDSQLYTEVVAQIAANTGADIIVLSNHYSGKALAGRLSAKWGAGLISGANSLPEVEDGIVLTKSVFSGKGLAHIKTSTPKKIIAINPNAYPPVKGEGLAHVVTSEVNLPDSKLSVKSVNKVTGTIPLSEADLVVSAGRGLKGPENWGMIEEMAKILGAATACSRAVSDVHWRPHYEHVGQTGLTIRPNLYIAIGISGAIQHLAGVNGSKVMVVINKDPEAPFFKAADYGIVGDAFEVVPKLNAALRKFKGLE